MGDCEQSVQLSCGQILDPQKKKCKKGYFLINYLILFLFFWLHWIVTAACKLLLLQSMGSRVHSLSSFGALVLVAPQHVGSSSPVHWKVYS